MGKYPKELSERQSHCQCCTMHTEKGEHQLEVLLRMASGPGNLKMVCLL